MDYKIREFRFPADYEAAYRLWGQMEVGVHLGRSDAPEEIQKKLSRDPDLFLVATQGEDVVGTIIGGYDGRRGMVYHLAVSPDHRRNGIGTRLVREVEKRLRAKGCVKCYLLVVKGNAEAIRFYERLGWMNMNENILMGREFQ